ncbi:4-hydroxyphenylacetate 3-monooxygenase reductase subunit [Agrobacterium sp. a22-2]|nr:4-hydroxyphenylacetate 3-monooxygenase reductase subunit [Agrobacterium sp. a22-2]
MPDLFRQAMSEVALAVHVLSTCGPAGEGAMTASSVCSVSLVPPTLLACVSHSSRMNAKLKENGLACVNTLAVEHIDVAEACANLKGKSGNEELKSSNWVRGDGFSCPFLRSAIFSCEGRIHSVSEVATHTVFFIEVQTIRAGLPQADPLIWHRRGFSSATGC